ncbi:MAG: hypothetical protein ABI758_06200 [Candidatus Woesebacteria bacterium]
MTTQNNLWEGLQKLLQIAQSEKGVYAVVAIQLLPGMLGVIEFQAKRLLDELSQIEEQLNNPTDTRNEIFAIRSNDSSPESKLVYIEGMLELLRNREDSLKRIALLKERLRNTLGVSEE